MKGVKFNGLHSYDEWGLLLSKKEIGSPTAKEKKVDIEGADGELDFTEALGGVKFNNRTLKFTFKKGGMTPVSILALVSDIQDAIHGKKLKVTLDDDPDWYYYGRIKVADFNLEKTIGTVVIEVDAEPYKLKQNLSGKIIHLAGRNLINLNEAIVGGTNTWVKTATGFNYTQTEGGGSYVYFNVPLEANKTYTFSVKGTNLSQTSLYIYTDRVYGTAYKNANAGSPCTFTPDKTGVYVCAIIANSTATAAEFSEVMLAEASSVGTFEPYNSTVRTAEVDIMGARMVAIPNIYATGEGIITSRGKTTKLVVGSSIEAPEMQIEQGNNRFTASASGRVLISWQEGRL